MYEGFLLELEEGLKEIENTTATKIEKCSLKVSHCQGLAERLRETFNAQILLEQHLQIHFFKKVKPRFFSELYFQIELFNYYKAYPKGSLKVKKQHINNQLDISSSFIVSHYELYHYVELGSSHLDDVYFKKVDYDLKVHGGLLYPQDNSFSSPAEPTLSRLLCAVRFTQFLKNELYALKNPTLDPTWEFTRNLNWNGSKTDLIELVYALTATDAIDAELKDTIQLLEKIFNIDLGNFYRTYTDIKLKRNPASFLDELKTNLLEKIRKENN